MDGRCRARIERGPQWTAMRADLEPDFPADAPEDADELHAHRERAGLELLERRAERSGADPLVVVGGRRAAATRVRWNAFDHGQRDVALPAIDIDTDRIRAVGRRHRQRVVARGFDRRHVEYDGR